MNMNEDGDSQEWLYELLAEVQLEQFYTKLRDDLQVTRLVFFCHLLYPKQGQTIVAIYQMARRQKPILKKLS